MPAKETRLMSEWTETTFFPEFRARYAERRHEVARRMFGSCQSVTDAR